MQPQVDGSLTRIFVKSGDHVKQGQVLMQIDPIRQQANVATQQSTQSQKKAVFDYNQAEVNRQKQLYDAGITSRQVYDQSVQAFANSKADYESSSAGTRSQVAQLGYYRIAAPFDGVVGDIPVHQGDYVSPTTILTTVDQMNDLEAYIYVPTDRAGDLHNGQTVDIVSNSGDLLQESKIDFISTQVDNALQGILIKAPVSSEGGKFRTDQLVKARVVWSTQAMPTVPVLAVTRINGESFVYVAVPQGSGYAAHQKLIKIGDTVGNNYAVTSGLSAGDKVIVSGTQFLQDGVPVQPMG